MQIDELASRLKESLGIVDHIGGKDIEEFFYGPTNEKVILEARSMFMGDYESGQKLMAYIYLRVGDLIYLDHSLKDKISEDLQKSLEKNLIFLWNFRGTLSSPRNMVYTALTLYGLTLFDLKDKSILDLGTGEGILAITALRLGAKEVVAVDINQDWNEYLKQNILHNNLNSEAIVFLTHDIRKTDELLQKMPHKNFDVMFAHLGPHYEDTDLKAISMLKDLEKVQVVLAGGYTKMSPEFFPYKAINLLSKLGFSKNFKEWSESKLGRTSFLVSRGKI